MIIHHQPVFLKQILNLIQPQDENLVDLTVGEGGHTSELLNLGKEIWGFERDQIILSKAQKRLICHAHVKKLHLFHANYSESQAFLEKQQVQVDFALFDLGISKFHYLESGRGFSFMKEEFLSMNLENIKPLEPKVTNSHFSKSKNSDLLTAAEIINDYSEKKLADLFYQMGNEIYSRICAKVIVNERKNHPIQTTLELSRLIEKAYRLKKVRTKIHPATKIFQALRITVNRELDHIVPGIRGIIERLRSGGRIAVISYHSLEDRIVKNLFNEVGKKGETYNKYREVKPIRNLYTSKVIKPDFSEVKQNPSARSAKMRVLYRS